MYGHFFLTFLLASAIAQVLSHDLLYKPIRRTPYEDLPDTIPIFKKIPAVKRSQPLHLPTLKSSTSHGNKCADKENKCILSTGQEGCCPYENGTCCADKLTCCPSGHQCNIKDRTCTVKQNADLGAVVCPDGQSQCPDGSTCCKLKSGQYGCCPLEKATCCSDGIHCCPYGYKCDLSKGSCSKGDSVQALTKTKTNADAVVCPDGQSQCPDGSTCCKLNSGQYGCCPLEKATCCSDGIHCCPNGYKCDVPSGSCSKGDIVQALTKTKTNAVVCPDGQSQCPDGSTCCKLKSGQYGCCPLEKATCCSDGIHCCPNGYKCDVSSGSCSKGDIVQALTKTKTNAVVCPDGQSQCPVGAGRFGDAGGAEHEAAEEVALGKGGNHCCRVVARLSNGPSASGVA